MPRALILVLDSVGIGGAEDAGAHGDAGADTLGHIAEACAEGRGDREALRAGPLRLPHLDALGLGLAAEASTGRLPPGLSRVAAPAGRWGYGVETSRGKDTPSGHWEIAGNPVLDEWGRFPDAHPCLPAGLVAALRSEGDLPGILGDRHAAGIAIVDELGGMSVATGCPILYSSADSVLQIAAHEEAFGLERLYALCRIARRLVDPLNIGRVIARPFTGDAATGFRRTPRRKDFSRPPPEGTILDRAVAAGREVVTIGKVGDIFAHRSTGREVTGPDNAALIAATLEAARTLADGGLLFANYVDFDTDHGHRRDVPGYAAALEAFDARVPDLRAALLPGDLCVITADHGNDPTWHGTDHTREHVPILAFGPDVTPGPLGRRETLADIGAMVAAHLGLPLRGPGRA